MKIISLSVLFLIGVLTAKAQLQLTPLPFGNGEKINMVASYYMKGMMTDLAGIELEVTDVPGKEKPIFRLKIVANTLTSWDDYVKVRHAYQTYVDVVSLKPLVTAQDSDVKGITTNGKYKFNHKEGNVAITLDKSDGNKVDKTIKIKEPCYDVVSMLYYCRAIDYSHLKIGTRTSINIAVLERALPVYIKYLGKETIKSSVLGNVECYKVALQMDEKFVVEPNVTFMWISADEHRYPVLINTEYKEGKAQVKLLNIAG